MERRRWNPVTRTSKSIRPLTQRLDYTLKLLTKMKLEQRTDSGSDDSSCSPSSTPETDKTATADDWVQAGHARVLERERDAARKILEDIDEIMHLMRPRWHQTPSMCGSYPCWIVWLPKEGTCERKTLKEAIIECAAQIIPENERGLATAPQRHDLA